MNVVSLGTYDESKPRVRILHRGLKENHVNLIECHYDIWNNIKDKSQLKGISGKLKIVWSYLKAYPFLLYHYFKLPKHQVVFIGYLGLFDVLALSLFIKLRKPVIIWDVFIPLYNTIVEDRKIISKNTPIAWSIYILEWIALRLVDIAIIDTEQHAIYLREKYGRTSSQVKSVLVGAEPDVFNINKPKSKQQKDDDPVNVLFYGQFIPLHGIETIVRAAKLAENENIKWLIIGKGQEQQKIKQLVDELKPKKLEWLEWVSYESLFDYLQRADVALGIFGDTDKAKRVIPNKVYQILMARRPLITADTPAIRELLSENECVKLIPIGDSNALVSSVLSFERFNENCHEIYESLILKFTPAEIGLQLKKMMLESSKEFHN